MYTLQTGKYSSLVWIVSKRNDDGVVEIYHKASLVFTKRYMAETPWYDTVALQPDTVYHIFCCSIQIHFAYLCGNEDVLKHGIGLLEFSKNELILYDASNMKEAYNQVFRNANLLLLLPI